MAASKTGGSGQRGLPNEPPEWWKRWRPLRWLAALLALILIASVARVWWPVSSAPEPVAVPAPASTPAADAATTPAATPMVTPAAAEAVAAPPPVAQGEAPAPAAPAAEAEGKLPPGTEIIEEAPITAADVRTAFTASVAEAQRVTFFAPFRSYEGVDAVYHGLEQAGYQPQLSSRHAKVPEGLPPSDLDIIQVYDYKHLGQNGKLEAQFFNDRLYQLEFEPKDADAYRPLFRRQWGQLGHEKGGRSEYVSGPLRIASSLDLSTSEVGQALRTRPFVLWQDLRLIRQRDDWDYQFAREAAH
ncbi:MAG: hypothetical protein ACREVL_18660 [Solimonas sp.]